MSVETRAEARDPRSVANVGLGEVAAVWAMYLVIGVLVLVTYSRVDRAQLYHVSHEGLAGGAGRLLVYLNYPTALAAVALVLFSVDRLPRRAWVIGVAIASVALCAVVVVPGVVDQGDLDARPVNTLPALGVALALVLSVAATREVGLRFVPRQPGDSARIVIAGVLLLVALPWLAAELGFYLNGPFMGSEIPTGEEEAAVHIGDHHGFNGIVFALDALVLSRALVTVRTPALQTVLGLYLALMLVYGLANAADDAWLEQLVKRGWVDSKLPRVVEPRLTAAWGLIVLGTIAVYALVFRRLRPAR